MLARGIGGGQPDPGGMRPANQILAIRQRKGFHCFALLDYKLVHGLFHG